MDCDVLTTLEAARYVRLSKPTLERFRVTGEGPLFAKLGGAVRYRSVDLDKWLENSLVASTSAVGATQRAA
jgi:excisionase family DNA binding protein